MVRSTARRAALVLIVAALGVGLSGCTSSDKDAEPTVATTQAAPEVEATTDATVAAEPTEAEAPAAGDQAAALDAVVAEAQAALPTLMDTFGDTYSDIKILAVDGDTFEYAYTYSAQVDAAAAATSFDAQVDMLQSAAESSVIPELERAGVTESPKVRFTYYNADGTLIWSQTFAKP